jgi:YD repeat-containing protein
VSNYDPNGALCLDKQGVAVYNYTYDKWGNRLNESFYGIKNNPVANQRGYAKAIYTYDIHNHRIEATYYDVKGRPISLKQ